MYGAELYGNEYTMKSLTLMLFLLTGGTVSAQAVSFQTLKGKKYDYRIDVPAGKYEHDVSSSERESWGGTNEPYVRVDAQKNIDYPDGPNWAARGGMYSFAVTEGRSYNGEVAEFTETRKEIKDGYKYEAHFLLKSAEASREYYVIGAALTQGKYKFSERKWVIATLVFHKPHPDREAITARFFESFRFSH